MTVKRLNFESPYGCRWCGIEQRRHGRRWAPIIQMHPWLEPDQAMIRERMWRRLEVRLDAEPAKYHATTLAVAAVLVAVWAVFAGHPWWTFPAGWVAFLTAFLGGRCHLAHHRTTTHPTVALTSRTRP